MFNGVILIGILVQSQLSVKAINSVEHHLLKELPSYFKLIYEKMDTVMVTFGELTKVVFIKFSLH